MEWAEWAMNGGMRGGMGFGGANTSAPSGMEWVEWAMRGGMGGGMGPGMGAGMGSGSGGAKRERG